MNVARPGHIRQGSRDRAEVASTQEGASLLWRVSGSRRLGCAAFVACPEGVVDGVRRRACRFAITVPMRVICAAKPRVAEARPAAR